MRVLMMVGDPIGTVSGCGLYRIHQPTKMLRAYGHQVTVTDRMPGYLNHRADGLVEVVQIPDLPYDVVVLQRPAAFTLGSTIRHIRAQGIAVVVELDDDLERTDADNAAYRAVHPLFNPAENWQHLKEACRQADLVTVSTAALLRYAPAGRGVVLPNFVPEALTDSVRAFGWTDGLPRVGWSGTMATHPHDFQTTRGGIAAALVKTGAPLHVVGPGEGVREALNLAPEHPMTDTGWLPISQYPDALTAIDVGVVPLDDTQFNAAKSHLKGIEFAGLGIPFVASPTPEYQRLFDEHGIGLLAHRPRDWERLVTELVNDEGMRRDLGGAWRAKVRADLTYEVNGRLWVDAYEKAIRNAAGRGKSGLITVVGR